MKEYKVQWVKSSIVTESMGISKNALNIKRCRSILVEGLHWRKAPDNVIYYNLCEIQNWIEG